MLKIGEWLFEVIDSGVGRVDWWRVGWFWLLGCFKVICGVGVCVWGV